MDTTVGVGPPIATTTTTTPPLEPLPPPRDACSGTTRDKLGRCVLASTEYNAGHPWSSFRQEDAFDYLIDHLRCICDGTPPKPFPCEEAGTRYHRRELFRYDKQSLYHTEVKVVAQQALRTLTNNQERISTRDLRFLLEHILPDAVRLPFFIHERTEDWSWFVFDDLGHQDQWQSVGFIYQLHQVDRAAKRVLTGHTFQPLTTTTNPFSAATGQYIHENVPIRRIVEDFERFAHEMHAFEKSKTVDRWSLRKEQEENDEFLVNALVNALVKECMERKDTEKQKTLVQTILDGFSVATARR